MTEYLKLIYILMLRGLLRILFILPIKRNRVFFESFAGEKYDCNPKYISEALCSKYGQSVEAVWAIKDKNRLPAGVQYCKFRSLKHIFYRVTSKVYVCNYLQAGEIPKRKGQIEIQTWHGGGCYKKIGADECLRSRTYSIRRDMHVRETDYCLVSSRYWEERVLREQLGYKGEVLETGMPRNDILVGEPSRDAILSIRKKAGIERDAFAVLYAPTWREGTDTFEKIDYEVIKRTFEKRFGKKVQMLFRAHVYGKEAAEQALDLTDYPDMQELLYACDALITDYSSSMWDFSLTERPCFLYVPDLARYTQQRGFDMDIHTWGFPVCETNEKLAEAIESFDPVSFRKAMRAHRETLGSFEKGTATEQVVQMIGEICGALEKEKI